MPHVTLLLAQGPGFPDGSAEHRYELAVGLTPGGALDPDAWQADPEPWPATRSWGARPVETGHVLWEPGIGWSLHFAGGAQVVHVPLRGAGPLRPGEYLTTQEPDARDYGWRVVAVGEGPAPA